LGDLRATLRFALVVVARNPVCVRDALILHRQLQDHAVGEFVDESALDFLPWRLALGNLVPACAGEFLAALTRLLGDANWVDGEMDEDRSSRPSPETATRSRGGYPEPAIR